MQSFDVRTLKYLHAKYPQMRLLYLIDNTSGGYDAAMTKLGFVLMPSVPTIPWSTQPS